MKKFLVSIITLLCVALSIGLTACNKGEYYILTFEAKDGVTYESEIMSGAQVLEGYDVKFKLKLDEGVEGTPVVNAGETVLTPSADGFYTFEMKGDTVVSVSGVNKIRKCDVAFDKGTYRISYECEQGDADEGFTVNAGDKIRFKVNVSSYYIDEYEVAVNTEIVSPDSDGWYSAYVTDDTTVRIYGLEQELGFTDRADGGRGTATNPYKISKPIDLFYMAELVNNEFWAGTGYYAAHYELTNDIDMEGEQMFIIGDMTSSTAFFGGLFNGNGHTIKNFYISDVKIEQENFTEQFIPYVGMFGYAAATVSSAPQIYNLTLSDFTIDVNAQRHGQMFAAGGIVGVGIGANIVGCRVENATISADADLGYFGYMGGIIGVHQSAYETDQTRFYAYVNACSSDVNISVDSGYVYAAGGIAGYQMAYEEKTSAFILNSYATGSVTGAIHAGGIVGRTDSHTAIQSCYSDGFVEAQSSIGVTGDDAADVYAHAYAGGITGFADNEALISDCFSSAETFAYSEIDDKAYEHTGSVVGYVNLAGAVAINTASATVRNSYGADSGKAFNTEFFKNTLKWSEADWSFGDGYPTTNKNDASKTFTVTVSYGNETVDGNGFNELEITDIYIPMSYWYLRTDADGEYRLPQYVTADSGKRSYGYFFDEAKTKRVPYGFVPTADVTLYTGFADYSEVAGTYYVIPSATLSLGISDKAVITLTADGTASLTVGARKTESTYYYLGDSSKTVYIEWTALARLGVYADEETAVNAENYYYTFKANVNNGVLTAYDGTYITSSAPVIAVTSNAFAVGEYYCGSEEMIFYENGFGEVVGGEDFSYAVANGTINIKYLTSGATISGTVNAAEKKITVNGSTFVMYDELKGIWEASAQYEYEIVFDGKGGYKMLDYSIVAGKLVSSVVEEGAYEANQYGYMLNGGTPKQMTVNEDGSLSVYSVRFYRNNSFVGKWTYRNVVEPVVIELKGIGVDGVGKAVIKYTEDSIYELTYESQSFGNGVTVVLYEGDFAFAELFYDVNKRTLSGDIYDALTGMTFDGVTLTTTDFFAGSWISAIDGLELVTFNGLGFYNLKGDLETLASYGKVTVNGKASGRYEIVDNMLKAKFSHNGVEYTVEQNGNVINVYADSVLVGTLAKYDALYGKTLVYGNAEITFDGKSVLGSGKATVIVGGESTVYDYVMSPATGDIIITDYANIVNDNGVYKVGTDSVFFRIAAQGSWIVGGSGDALVISGASLNGKVDSVSYGGTVYTDATVDFESGTVYFGDYVLSVLEEGYLAFSDGIGAYVCVSSDTVDAFAGVWSGADGSKLAFDGLGEAVAYGGGMMKLINANNDVVGAYSYTFNERGVLQLIMNGAYHVFVECESTDAQAFTMGGEYYAILLPDELYDVTAKVSGSEITYYFDGLGTITTSGNDEYAYEITAHDETAQIITVTVTFPDREKTATVDYSGRTVTVTIND